VKIFVSYSRRDADFAQHVHEYFSDSEHDIFTDVNNIEMGDVWGSMIEKNISNCEIFVVIITHASLRSAEIEKEVLQAQRENKTIIPCIHKDVSHGEIKWDLAKLQGIEFDDKYELARNLFSRIEKSKQKNHKITSILSEPKSDKLEPDKNTQLEEASSSDKILSSNPSLERPKDSAAGSTSPIIPQIPPRTSKIIAQDITSDTPKPKAVEPPINTSPTYSTSEEDGRRHFDTQQMKKPQRKNKILLPAIAAVICIVIAVVVIFGSGTVPHDDKIALDNKGQALYYQGNNAEAITYYDKALAIDPNDTIALNGKGNSLNGLGDYAQAIQYFDKALAINPNDASALNGKGNSLSLQGNDIRAIQYFDKALAIRPNDINILYNKADSLNRLGNYTEAIKYYDRSLAIDPNYKIAIDGKNTALRLSHIGGNAGNMTSGGNATFEGGGNMTAGNMTSAA
jgi:tetratricopeptide (TPR) repeat protein